jgi:hypothetical protein
MYNRHEPKRFRRTSDTIVINTPDGELTTVRSTGDSTLVKTNGDKIVTIRNSGDVTTTLASTGVSTLINTNGNRTITVPRVSKTFINGITGQTTIDYILIIHLDASVKESITMVGNVVSSWTGQTNKGVASTIYNGNDPLQQVTYSINGLNNKPTLIFPELAALNLGRLPNNARITTQDVAVFIVLQDNDTGWGTILGWAPYSAPNEPFFSITANENNVYGGGIGNQSYMTNKQSDIRFTTPVVLVYVFRRKDIPSFSVWRNNVLLSVDNVTSNNTNIIDISNNNCDFGIGGRGINGRIDTNFGQGFNGKISEIKIYATSFTDADILSESTKLYTKWIQ